MTYIDALGQVCPIPVIRAKKAIEALGESGGVVTVLVDNDISRQNLEKMATGLGHQSEYLKKDDGNIEVTIAVGEGCAAPVNKMQITETTDEINDQSGIVVAIGRNTMGEGSEELGLTLMKSFIISLKELNPPPTHILLFNTGAFLSCSDSSSLSDLQALAAAGTVILTCGTCINYYGLTEKLAVGDIANMYDIVTAMAGAKRLINM